MKANVKFCSKCGYPADDMKFCSNCGNALDNNNIITSEQVEQGKTTLPVVNHSQQKKEGSVFKSLISLVFWGFILWLIVPIFLGNLGIGSSTKSETTERTADNAIVQENSQESSSSTVTTSSISMGQKNALGKAASYLDFAAFSYSGLIEQLKYEGFSDEDATYAADNCGADWNEQASKKAKSYLEFTSFSRASLIDQLLYEGFTSDQAEYGATSVGY
ncbi:Ltp family lipoprotein [Acetobacterium wieringae]|nr:Ltp family lipoprotein [Acetobacterium wieringae]